ncbi:MAG: hypothetical protein ACTHOF_14470 [Flavisolibacter sp.]
MKKFELLGRSLSKEQMKNVFGGVSEPPKECTTNDDCGTKDFYCGTEKVTSNGKCYQGTCRYGYVCV